MSRSVIKILAVWILILIVVGCDRQHCETSQEFRSATPGQVITNAALRSWASLSPDAAIVLVGDRALSKADLSNILSNEYAALAANGPVSSRQKAEFTKRLPERTAAAVSRFIYEGVFLLEAEERGITADPKDVAEQWSLVSNLCERTKIPLEKLAIMRGMGSSAGINGFIKKQCVLRDVFAAVFSNRLEVADKEVDELYSSLQAKNEESARTNAVYLAEMKKLADRLIVDEVKMSDDDEANAKLVPSFCTVDHFVNSPATAFDDEDVFLGHLAYARVGAWQQPVEFEDSIEIFYFSDIQARSGGVPTLYSGYRISREKDHGYLLPEKSKLKEDIRKRRNIQVVTPEVERLKRKFGVLFPYGFVWEGQFDLKTKHSVGGDK